MRSAVLLAFVLAATGFASLPGCASSTATFPRTTFRPATAEIWADLPRVLAAIRCAVETVDRDAELARRVVDVDIEIADESYPFDGAHWPPRNVIVRTARNARQSSIRYELLCRHLSWLTDRNIDCIRDWTSTIWPRYRPAFEECSRGSG